MRGEDKYVSTGSCAFGGSERVGWNKVGGGIQVSRRGRRGLSPEPRMVIVE